MATSLLLAADARAQFTRVSVATNGAQANGRSVAPSVSADGRFVAFASAASNLVASDTNRSLDAFVRDRLTNTTTRVSVTSAGVEGVGGSASPSLSANGRFVAFNSSAPLGLGDTRECDSFGRPAPTNCYYHVYLHDREIGTTSRVSRSTQGQPGDGESVLRSISGDGRFVLFTSRAGNLVEGDTNGAMDAFLHDGQTGTTIRVSDPSGFDNGFAAAVMSADGRVIAYSGSAPANALPLTDAGTPTLCFDQQRCPATYLYERETGTRILLSAVLPTVPSTRRLIASVPSQISANGAIVIIKVWDKLPVVGGGQGWEDARTLLHDRTTRSTVYLPLVGSPGDSQYGVFALSANGRYFVEPGSDSTPSHRFFIVDRLTALREGVPIPRSNPLEYDPSELSLSMDGATLALTTGLPLVGADTNTVGDAFIYDQDFDNDGLPSYWETAFGLNPNSPTDAGADPDGDGLTNFQEYQRGSHPDKGVVRYLAEGAANGFMTTRLAVLNPNDTVVEAAFRLLGSQGHTTAVLRTLAPRSRTTIVLAHDGPVPGNDFATSIESTQPIVVDRTMTWDASAYGAHAETAVAAPSPVWYLAEGATHGGFDLFYLLQNATSVDATVTVKFFRPAPHAPVTETYTVLANSRRTIWVDVEDPALSATDVSATITSDQPIIVERAMYASTPTQAFAAGHNGMGLTSPALTWFLAEGATGSFFDLYVLAANPGTETAAFRVTYLLPNGQTVSKNYEVVGESRLTISVHDEDPRLADTPVSMIIESINNRPIVVERAMWWPHGQWHEGHLSAGTTTTGTRWALAEGEIGGSAGNERETYILIANASANAGFATVTLLIEGGDPITRTVQLPALSRVSLPLAGLFPAGVHARFGTIVDSNGVQIVVERAMYANARGVVWAAGTSAIATKLQ